MQHYMTYQEFVTYIWLLWMSGIWFTAKEIFCFPDEKDDQWF